MDNEYIAEQWTKPGATLKIVAQSINKTAKKVKRAVHKVAHWRNIDPSKWDGGKKMQEDKERLKSLHDLQ